MRELKFRYMYQHEECGYWTSKIFILGSGLTVGELEELSIEDLEISGTLLLIQRYQIIARNQYTGLKDKNGKEICEGDLVEYCGYFGEIIYNDDSDGGARFMPRFADDDCVWHEKERWYNLEIIGNIYENPELLK